MSRDPGDATASAPERTGAANRDDLGNDLDDDLLAAYVDGVAELAPDERHRVEARLTGDPRARAGQAAVRALLDQLRALPSEGTEPDWATMERSIRASVGRDVPRPWWRRWTWLAPAALVAAAAALVLVMWSRPAPGVVLGDPRAVGSVADPDPRPADEVVALWLDGAEVDVDLSAADLLGDAAPNDPTDLADLADPADLADLADLANDNPDVAPPDAAPARALLPATNLAWVDGLDDDAIDRAERWLAGAGKKG
jgi:hypothetical protein